MISKEEAERLKNLAIAHADAFALAAITADKRGEYAQITREALFQSFTTLDDFVDYLDELVGK